MEKKKCILYGFAVLSALTGMALSENLEVFGEELPEEAVSVEQSEVVENQEILSESQDQFMENNGACEDDVDNEELSLEKKEIGIGNEIEDSILEDNTFEAEENNIFEGVNNEEKEQVVLEDVKNDSVDESKASGFVQSARLESVDVLFKSNSSTVSDEASESIVSPYAWIGDQYGYGTIENEKFVFYLDGQKYEEKELVNDSWIEVNINDKTIKFYVKDNRFAYGVQVINSNPYYFNSQGELVTNSYETNWDYDTQSSFGIYAGKDGVLQKGWVETENGKYYFGNDYKGITGIQIIDGKQYYLDCGRVNVKYAVLDDGLFYYFGEDGSLNKQVLIQNDQWINIGNDYFYVKDNQIMRDQLAQIGNNTYGFNYDGLMFADTSFWMNDGSYRADKSGALIKGWYKGEYSYSETFYYGPEYKALKGIQIVDGKKYVFNMYNGALVKGSVEKDEENKKAYISDANGILIGTIDCKKNGWVQCKGTWYYVDNNKPVYSGIKKINNVLYAFNNYKMIDDAIEYTWNYDGSNEYSGKVKAKPGGALVTSEWGTSNYATYYFGVDGLAVKGYQKIGNHYYYFDPSEGILRTDDLCNIGDSNWIRVDASGKQIASFKTDTDGWKAVSNGDWIYVENNEIQKRVLKTIGGFKYYLGYNGLMYRNIAYWDSDAQGSADKSSQIYFGNDGASIRGWVQDKGEWYYYGDDFYGVRGLKTINDTVYAFSANSIMQTKVILPSRDGTFYSFDGKGVGAKISPSAGFYMNRYYVDSNHKAVSGWKYIDKNWYYFDPDTKEMMTQNGGLRRINNKSYQFDYDGKMLTGWIFDGSRYALSDGSLKENGWLQIAGSWYYFKDTVKQIGAIIDGSNKYVLNKTGDQYKLINQKNGWVGFKNEWFYLDNGEFIRSNSKIINGQTYGFDDNGFMVKNKEYLAYYFDKEGHAIKNQWLEVRPKMWRYYDQNGIFVTNGWKTIGNAKYYFGSNGIIKTTDTIIDGELCKFSSSGALIGTPAKINDGWNFVDGYWYYSKDGSLFDYGLYKIGNNEYYFQNSKMAMNEVVYGYRDGKNRVYFATKDGSLAKNRWCGPQSQYYAQADGELKSGLVVSGGKQYYINPNTHAYIKDTSFLASDENKVYIADKTGVITQVLDAKNLNGWVKGSNKKYYLVLNHKFVTFAHESGNKIYWMDPQTGIMAENMNVYMMNGLGYADASGSISKNGWSDNTYFINGTNTLGPQKIDGKDYYFDYRGYTTRVAGGGISENTEKVYQGIDGAYYYFDGKGNKKKIAFKEGWNQYNGEWYYIGDVEGDTLFKINGAYYVLGGAGKMMKNQLVWDTAYEDYTDNRIYYVDENGNLAKGWKYVNNQWYYFGEDYQAVKGLRKIDGKEYVFSRDGVML